MFIPFCEVRGKRQVESCQKTRAELILESEFTFPLFSLFRVAVEFCRNLSQPLFFLL